MTRTFPHILRLIVVATLLSACSGAPVQKGPDGLEPGAAQTEPTSEPQVTENTPRLEEAADMLEQGQPIPAASILSRIDPGKLVADDMARYGLIESRIRYQEGDRVAALASVEYAMQLAPAMHPALLWQLRLQQISLIEASAGPIAGAEQAASLIATELDELRREQLSALTWKGLQRSPVEVLQSAYQTTTDPQWQAWLELALASSDAMQSPAELAATISSWQATHPDHPVAASLPGNLGLIEELAAVKAQQVTLILPLSGPLAKAGSAVLDGFTAAWFEAGRRGWPETRVSVMDSTRWENINDAYAAAVASGAEIVIGPLTKTRLSQWRGFDIPTPLLALNQFETPPLDNQHVYQFGLAPEDEAGQIAQMAFSQGAREAFLIYPEGAWGTDMARALEKRWIELGGHIRTRAAYSDREDYSNRLKHALLLDDSEERAKRIRQIMGTRVEFTPRRRQDIDCIFLLSGKPEEARAIKPLLAFHYAGQLPVYSSSHVFSGRHDPARDRDLNGTYLIEIPWLVQADNNLRESVRSAGGVDTLSAMYALGADAFILHWRLPQLATAAEASIRGQTGLLTMDERGRLHRELSPARMQGGLPLALGSGE